MLEPIDIELWMLASSNVPFDILTISILTAILAGIAAWSLARSVPGSCAFGLLGLLPAIALSVLFSAVSTFAVAFAHVGAALFGSVAQDPIGAVSFFLESGIEFGLLGIAAAVGLYCLKRIQMSRA